MTTNPSTHQSACNNDAPAQPYPPSWADRFFDWVKRLPVPSWLFHLGLWLALFLLINALKWLDGSQPLGTIEPLLAFGAALAIYLPAMMHYLNEAASAALRTFRPALAVNESEYAKLHYQLTTLPARGAWLGSGIGITMAVLYMLFRPTAVPDYITSLPVLILDSGLFICALTALGALIYHTIHQLRTVSRIHASATHINLFQLDPLYAFSGLTARTVLGYILIVDTAFLFIREVMSEEANDPEVIGLLTLVVLLAVVTFVLPLLGMHRRMVEEKERLESEANQRLEAAITELHRRVDAAEFSDMTELYRAIAGLEIELDVMAKIPTWPWQPGTLRVALSPLLLPVAVWLIQRLLERFAGL